MAVAVQADPVARGDDLAGERGVAPHLLADEEEGRAARRCARQDLEHRGRALRVRAVVEGERVAARRWPCGPRLRAARAAPGQIAAASPGSR